MAEIFDKILLTNGHKEGLHKCGKKVRLQNVDFKGSFQQKLLPRLLYICINHDIKGQLFERVSSQSTKKHLR